MKASGSRKDRRLKAELARVLATCSQPGARLALTAAPVAVGVLRRQFMPPLAARPARIAGVHGQDALSGDFWSPGVSRPGYVVRQVHCFPVRRVLAGPVLAGVASWALAVTVVARVINRLANLKRPLEVFKAVTMRRYRASAMALREVAIVLLVAIGGPRPAVIWSAPINEGEVPLQFRQVPAEGAATHAGPPQPVVMRLAQLLRPRGRAAFATYAVLHPLMAGFEHVPVSHELPVMASAQPSGMHGPIAVLAIRHNTILARAASGKAV